MCIVVALAMPEKARTVAASWNFIFEDLGCEKRSFRLTTRDMERRSEERGNQSLGEAETNEFAKSESGT
jgi:hypothetical protein